MKKFCLLISLVLMFQSKIAFARTEYNFYDDPSHHHAHLNFKTKKSHKKALKLNIPFPKTEEFIVKKFKLNNVIIESNPTNIKVDTIYKPYLNKIVAHKDLKEIISRINARLHDNGLILSFAYVSNQSIDEGNVTIKIVNGKIRDVKIISDANVSQNKLFNDYVSNILKMEPVYNDELQKNIHLINLIPGYNVKYNLEPIEDSHDPEEIADLIFIIDKEAGDISFTANNQGTKSIGKYQYYSLANLYNSFNSNEKISIHAGSTNEFDALKIATFAVEKFINSYGTTASLLGSYIEDNPYVVLPGSADKNKSTLFIGTIGHYLLLKKQNSFQITGGYEHRDSENNTVGSKLSSLRYGNVFIGSNIEFLDPIKGNNYLALRHHRSIPGQTTIKRYTSDADILDRNYNFTTIDLYREQDLYKNLSLFNQLVSQFGSKNIPIEQKFFVGGLTTGRGYKNGLLASNRGLDFSAELRYSFFYNNLIKEIQPYGFYDVAKFSKSSATSNKSTLQSAGLGLRVKTHNDFSLLIESGIPFTRKVTVEEIEHHNSNKFSFLASKEFRF
ncbi:MAG: ShlB/FhaC/HecB family hemolysin secretion/activation protein [Rickettsiales bacterium]